jgi:hypothetical protein
VFTFDRWNKHRNSLRYVKHLTHVFTSRIFRNLRGPVVVVMAMAVLVGTYETLRTVSRAAGPASLVPRSRQRSGSCLSVAGREPGNTCWSWGTRAAAGRLAASAAHRQMAWPARPACSMHRETLGCQIEP